MGRLHALIALHALVFSGCNEAPPAGVPPSRVIAVEPKVPEGDPLEAFCDVLHAPGRGASLRVPPVEGTAPAAGGRYRWVNLWATWCKPCVEEIPRIVGLCDELAKKGESVSFELVSVDADAALVESFRKEHADVPETLRLTDASTLQPWLEELGLDPGAGLPIHVFVEKTSHVRCVRAGAVSENDYAAVASLVE